MRHKNIEYTFGVADLMGRLSSGFLSAVESVIQSVFDLKSQVLMDNASVLLPSEGQYGITTYNDERG